MNNFVYKNTTEILFGEKQIDEIATRIPNDAKVLLLYGGGSIKKNGVYDDVMRVLEQRHIVEFQGIGANPTYEKCLEAVAICHEKGINFILAVGGGSVVDAAKFIAAATEFEGDPWDILAKAACFTKALPIGAVMTLPATGSESNSTAVITREETLQKLAFYNNAVRPQFAVLDPTYTYSLPIKQITNGVVDAFIHVIEQYLTYPVNGKIQDRFAEGILLTLMEEGPKALLTPQDYDIRANIMWSATMALNGLIGVGVPQDWATHRIDHEFTALYGMDHAQTLAIVLPALLEVKREQKGAKIVQFAERVLGITGLSQEDSITQGIAGIRKFFEVMGLKTRISECDLDVSAIDEVVAQLIKNKRLALGEHGDITPEVSREILKLAL